MDNQASFAQENDRNDPGDALPSLIWISKAAELAESVFASDSRISITHTDNIIWDKATNEFVVSLNSGHLNSPMGGVSFNMVPHTENEKQTVVSLGLRYSVKFPTEFLWNLGGHLPGLFGTYVSSAGTSAAANDVFECRCRWDAKGKLGVNVRQNSEYDPNEWAISAQNKVSLTRDTWYDISLIAHIDGSLEVSVDGTPLFQGACHAGFENLSGVRFCAYSMDTMGIEGSYLKIKNVEIRSKFHNEC